ncbi:uncharacterized protein LOC131673547 [Phymastichus coffea]|uniref:uncharacterized protein LOC131673547 n=1 Tax=Phymastichus coffea TaxID=108790 RepID=UPI00273B3547|nr:uncharacterized protein LOC131673547 [Phymastichus coffea]
MSKKITPTSRITSNDSKLTRSQTRSNPQLKSLLHKELEKNAFRRSSKIQYSPTKKTKETQAEISRTEDSSATQTEEQDSVLQENNFSTINTTIDLDRNQRYSDFGGIYNEQSLILGSSKDIFSNLELQSQEEGKTFPEKDKQEIILQKNFENNLQKENPRKSDFLALVNIDTLIEDPSTTKQKTKIIRENSTPSINKIPTNMNNQEKPMKLQLKDVAAFVAEFDGKNISPMEYISTLKEVKDIIDDIDERNLTKLLKIKIKGEVKEAIRGSKVENITDLINVIRTLYPIKEDIHALYAKVRQISQEEDESIVHYTNRLRQLVLRIKELNKWEDTTAIERTQFEATLDKEAAKSYRKGLKAEIRYEIGPGTTVQEMSTRAIDIESDIEKRKYTTKPNRNYTYSNNKEEFQETKILICQICREFSHEALFCRTAACVYCKGTDHFSNSCKRVPKKINLICKFCSQPSHSISACRLNKRQNIHCQYCQEMGHEVDQCAHISNYEACWKCNETGHNPINCKNDQTLKQKKCENCEKIGHTVQQCPEVICRKCNNMGHLVKDCKAGEIKKSLYKICATCKEVGHEQDTCDQ